MEHGVYINNAPNFETIKEAKDAIVEILRVGFETRSEQITIREALSVLNNAANNGPINASDFSVVGEQKHVYEVADEMDPWEEEDES